jgi:hypothetical protein
MLMLGFGSRTAVAALLALCAAARGAAAGDVIALPSPELEKLMGPLSSPGKPASVPNVAGYDTVLLARWRQYADLFPDATGVTIDLNGDGLIDLGDYVFYDLPLVEYQTWYRTGDLYWRNKARATAAAWRDYPGNQKMHRYLAGEWQLWPELEHEPRCMGTLGLAVFALESGDAAARQVVYDHALLIEATRMYGSYETLSDPVMPLGDPRECGYSLMALTAATVIGQDHSASAKDLLNHILLRQRSDGQWLSRDDSYPEGGYTSNFMTGILLESLALYDRAIGDARILPAVEKNLAWTWSTQWVSAGQAFQYHAVGDTTAQPNLNGLLIEAWGYAWSKTGKQAYLTQGNQIFTGIVDRGTQEIWGVKQYCQIYRASPRYLGYVAARASGLPGDANQDGAVTLADLNVLVDWILLRNAPPAAGSAAFMSADVSKNGSIGLEDINLIVDYLLGRITQFP